MGKALKNPSNNVLSLFKVCRKDCPVHWVDFDNKNFFVGPLLFMLHQKQVFEVNLLAIFAKMGSQGV